MVLVKENSNLRGRRRENRQRKDLFFLGGGKGNLQGIFGDPSLVKKSKEKPRKTQEKQRKAHEKLGKNVFFLTFL